MVRRDSRTVFVDSGYWVALELADDQHHWITSRHLNYKSQHLIPDDPSLYTLDRFLQFVDDREQMIRKRINDLSLVA